MAARMAVPCDYCGAPSYNVTHYHHGDTSEWANVHHCDDECLKAYQARQEIQRAALKAQLDRIDAEFDAIIRPK